MSLRQIISCLATVAISLGSMAQGNGIITGTDNMVYEHFYLSALQYKLSGNYSRAFEILSTCRKLQPGNSAVCFEMARIMADSQHFDYAADFATEAVEHDTTSNLYYINFAIAANLQANRIEQALEMYDRIINVEPDNIDNYLQKFAVYMSRDEYQKALDFLKTIPTRDDATKYEVDIRYFEVYIAMQKYSKAEKLVKKLYKENPNSAKNNYMYSRVYFYKGNNSEAINYCKRATELPQGGTYYFTLAGLYDAQKMDSLYADACRAGFLSDDVTVEIKRKRFYEMLTRSDNYATIRSWRGLYLDIMNILNKQYPEDTGFCVLRQAFYIANKETESSRQVLQDFVSKYPADDYIWRSLITEYADIPDSLMLSYTARAIEDVPEQPLFYILHGQQLQIAKRYVDSIDPLKTAYKMLSSIESNDEVKGIINTDLNLLATAYFFCDSSSQAFAYYDQILSEDGSNPLTLNNYAYYLAIKGLRLDEAEKMSMRSLSADPLNPTYLDTYAYILFRREKYQEALFVMERCMDNSKSLSYEEYDHYGDILYFLGRKDEALIQWRKALELESEDAVIQKKVKYETYYSE